MKPFTRKQHLMVLGLLFLVTLVPRLPFRGPYLYDGDPVAYYEGALQLVEQGTYLVDGKIPFWPIGTSLTMAPLVAVMKRLGLPAQSAAFWHGFLTVFMAVAFIYLIGKWLFQPATGIIAALLLAFAESVFLHSVNSASDPGALAMLLGASYFMLLFQDTQAPRDLFLSFFLLGLSFLFRWNYALFLPLFLIFLVGDKRIWAFHLYPRFWILGFAGFVAGVAPQLWFNYQHFGNPLSTAYSQLGYSDQFGFQLGFLLKNILRVAYRVLFTWDFYSPLLAGFGVFGVISLVQERRRDIFWLFVPWIVLGTLSVIYFGVKPRLLMPLMPPFFLLGAEGLVWVFRRLVSSWKGLDRHQVLPPVLFGILALLLFLPMLGRTFLHTHGHFQEKVIMQEAFRWAGRNSLPGTTLITQPMYAGQNDDWIRAGWREWASRLYSGREVVSLRYPETWARDPGQNLVVVNRFWFQGENMRFADTDRLAGRFDSLAHHWNLVRLTEFEGGAEPTWLKKLNMLSYYPVDFMVFRPRFESWGVEKKLGSGRTSPGSPVTPWCMVWETS